ncbi:MAG: DUF1761 domain-containing protein [Limisphaerales bacterium]
MKRILLATFLATLVTFFFGAFFWMNPLANNSVRSVEDDTKVQSFLKENFPQAGTYTIPDWRQEEKEFHKKAEAGPVAILQVVESNGPSKMGAMMGTGFLSQLITVFVLCLLVNSCLTALPIYGDRVRFCTLVGLIAALFIDGGNMIWWHQSVSFTLFNGVYHIFSCVLAGLVIAKFVRPEQEKSSITQAGEPQAQTT